MFNVTDLWTKMCKCLWWNCNERACKTSANSCISVYKLNNSSQWIICSPLSQLHQELRNEFAFTLCFLWTPSMMCFGGYVQTVKHNALDFCTVFSHQEWLLLNCILNPFGLIRRKGANQELIIAKQPYRNWMCIK